MPSFSDWTQPADIDLDINCSTVASVQSTRTGGLGPPGDTFPAIYTDEPWTGGTNISWGGPTRHRGGVVGGAFDASEQAFQGVAVYDLRALMVYKGDAPTFGFPPGVVDVDFESDRGEIVLGPVTTGLWRMVINDGSATGQVVEEGGLMVRLDATDYTLVDLYGYGTAPSPEWVQPSELTAKTIATLADDQVPETGVFVDPAVSTGAPDDNDMVLLMFVPTAFVRGTVFESGASAIVVPVKADGTTGFTIALTYRPPRWRYVFAGRYLLRQRQRPSLGMYALANRQGGVPRLAQRQDRDR